jgi:hypothetical protein
MDLQETLEILFIGLVAAEMYAGDLSESEAKVNVKAYMNTDAFRQSLVDIYYKKQTA